MQNGENQNGENTVLCREKITTEYCREKAVHPKCKVTYTIAHSSESRICWAQKSDPKVCADAELSQAVHRGERRVDADRLWDIPPTEVYVCVEVKVVLKE